MQGWGASALLLLLGIKASWLDSSVLSSKCHQCPLPSDTGLSVSRRHRGGMAGTPHVGLSMESRFLGTNIPSQTLFPTRAGLAGNAAPLTCLWFGESNSLAGRDELWGQEVPGVQRGHLTLAPVRYQLCQGHPSQGPQHLGSLCLPPAMRGELQNLCFLNKALHFGKALRVSAVLGAERSGRMVVLWCLEGLS